MNREAEIERCADDVLQMAEYGQIESCTFKAKQVMEALRQALELPKQEPQHHIVDSNKMINYVPMSVDDYRKLAKNTTMPIGYEEWETVQAVEAETVKRIREQNGVSHEH